LAAARRRTSAAKRFKKGDSAAASIWKRRQVAERAFRRLTAPEWLPAVYAGAQYREGIKRTGVNAQEVAA
jgi:hypothetical protein